MENLDDLANKMFRVFARCEYALKAAGYHRGDGKAEPNWTAFAAVVENVLADPDREDLKEAIAYILNQPPKKQVIRNGMLEWSDEPPQAASQADLILLYVRRVRNNLFHGGKFNGRWFEPERSEQLLRHSLVILDACATGCSDVRYAYDH
ncbi:MULTISPECIES: hypothetical protein [Rhodomicrobium]|uniref:hypothetical protein n=1 Tax=Rhodomicrobium TaxID=1068 RepID=UPI001AECFDB3|nr:MULTISPECIES: hypothetical protein [Rhodomicrobium]